MWCVSVTEYVWLWMCVFVFVCVNTYSIIPPCFAYIVFSTGNTCSILPSPSSRSKPNCLVSLYSFLSHHIKPLLSSGRPVAVIVDDLSLLLGLGVGLVEVVDFVHYCQVLLCHSSEEEPMVCVCVCVCACVCVYTLEGPIAIDLYRKMVALQR